MILEFILLTLAVWRLSSLFANEEGPHMLFHKIRKSAERYERKSRWFRHSRLAHGLTCEWCNSMWFGALLGWPYMLIYQHGLTQPVLLLVTPLILSTGSIIIKTIVNTLRSIDIRYDQQNQEYIERHRTLNALADYREKHTATYEDVLQSMYEKDEGQPDNYRDEVVI